MRAVIGLVLASGIVGAGLLSQQNATSPKTGVEGTNVGYEFKSPNGGASQTSEARQVDMQTAAEIRSLISGAEELIADVNGSASQLNAAEVKAAATHQLQTILVRLRTARSQLDCDDTVCENQDQEGTYYAYSCHANFTSKGVSNFATIFGAAAARGIENATIRAMNATNVEKCQSPSPTPANSSGDVTEGNSSGEGEAENGDSA